MDELPFCDGGEGEVIKFYRGSNDFIAEIIDASRRMGMRETDLDKTRAIGDSGIS